MDFKLLITTSGTGSRLGSLTRETNKALIQINGKPIIAHIIDQYPPDIELVVTLGYFGDKVRNYLDIHYRNRNISYVDVDIFEGPGSSLGYSILCAKDSLQTPFIFHCNDTIVSSYIPHVDYNWAGGSKVSDASQYTTFSVDDAGWIEHYNIQKGADLFDFAHIGVVGIQEYIKFFEILERLYQQDSFNSALNDVMVLNEMIESGSLIKNCEFNKWLDTGNPVSFKFAKENL